MADLKKIFSPKTIAVIGASESDGSVGKALTENLLLPNNRKIFPVNPNRKSILGIDSYARIADIPEQIDLAVIATPAQTVPGIIEECGKSGVEGVIIVSAGFKETGKTGEKLEEQIKEIRRTYGMRIIGPNCLGVIRPVNRLNASFLRVHPEPGKIAFISHSGALGSAILDWAINAHIGFSLFVSLGSMIDVDFGDMIDFLGDDPDTKSIMLYMEGIGNARKFMSAARGFARNKPIIILKPLDLNLPKYWSKSNPIDVLGDADTGRYVMAVNICINDPNVHGIIIIYTPQGAANPEELAKAIADISKKSYKPIITVLMGGMKVEGAKKITLENNIPTYETPEEAIK